MKKGFAFLADLAFAIVIISIALIMLSVFYEQKSEFPESYTIEFYEHYTYDALLTASRMNLIQNMNSVQLKNFFDKVLYFSKGYKLIVERYSFSSGQFVLNSQITITNDFNNNAKIKKQFLTIGKQGPQAVFYKAFLEVET